MDQFNKDTYRKQTLAQEFYHSCLGKIVILAGIVIVLFVISLMTMPSDESMRLDVMDDIHQCMQDNQDNRGDAIDETFANIARTFTTTDSTLTNKEVLKAFYRYNNVQIYQHAGFKTAYVHNAYRPDGVRIGIGILGFVISTIHYDDLVLDLGPARGSYNNNKLIKEAPAAPTPETDLGENPDLTPFHYNGDPEN